MSLEWDDIADAAIKGVAGAAAGEAFLMIVKSEPKLSDLIPDLLKQIRQVVSQAIRENEIARVEAEAQTAIDLYRAYVNAPTGVDRLLASTERFAAVGRQLERFGISGHNSYLLNQSMYLHALADRRRLYGDAETENIKMTLRQSLAHNQEVIGPLYRRKVPYVQPGELRFDKYSVAQPDKPYMYENWNAYNAAQFSILRDRIFRSTTIRYRILKRENVPGSNKFKFYNKKRYKEEKDVLRDFYRAIWKNLNEETRPRHLVKPNKIYQEWSALLKGL